MRNLITGIFILLAGTFFVVGRQLMDEDKGKSEDQMKSVRDSVTTKPHLKTPEPEMTSSKNF